MTDLRHELRGPSDYAEHEPTGDCWDNAPIESFFSSIKVGSVTAAALAIHVRQLALAG